MSDKPLAARIVPDEIKQLVPSIARNVAADDIVAEMAESVDEDGTILIIGCGEGGAGSNAIPRRILEQNTIATDIYTTSFTDALCDAHHLPFQDRSIDAIVCQAVLEHVQSETDATEEMKRVLKPGGAILVDVPFIQPYHRLPHDYRRFSVFGLNQRFNDMERIDSGSSVGPTAGFFWVFKEYTAYLLSFGNRSLQTLISHGLDFFLFWGKYLDSILLSVYGDDPWLLKIPSGVYWYGRKPFSTPD